MKNRLEEDKRLVRVVPSARQLAYQEMEFFCSIHFTVNTFTGSEWGDGIPFSQRVEKFRVCYETGNGCMKECYQGTTIGYKRIIDLNKIKTTKLVIDICDSRVAPVISFVGVY